MTQPAKLWAEFASPEGLLTAARALVREGHQQLDAYTPFCLPELESIIALPRPRLLPGLVLGAALAGGSCAFALIWWTAKVDYPLDVGGRPLSSLPADIPIVFETSILCAAVTAFLALLALSGLPRLHHSLESLPGFVQTSDDRYWLGVGVSSAPESAQLAEQLRSVGATRVHDLGAQQ
jgi:hypothetical protein